MFFRCLFHARRVGQCLQGCVQAAGILDKSAHGLRTAAATRGNGATEHEQIVGWVDFKEAKI